ncbi:MAG: thioredoxin family protein [Lentisphaeria bacterium]|nr:thioredoxin family protein [Lentisphaeria bacterium]
MKQSLLLAGVCALSLMVSAAVETGKPAPDFTLTDINGTEHSLSDFKGKTVVLEWTNYDCPFVKKHYGAGNMQALQKKYTDQGVIWLSICSSAPGKQGHFTTEEWLKRSQEAQALGTAILVDADGKTGKLYGAKTTPHLFVIDTAGTIAYQGAIDDQRSWDPKTIKGAKNYVAAALDALLAGKPVAEKETQPYGCSVKY